MLLYPGPCWLAISCCIAYAVARPFDDGHDFHEQSNRPLRRSQAARDAITSDGFEFIDPQSYFAISTKCKSDTRSLDRQKWSNRFDFYKRAISDATRIAKAAEKWPQLGADASDLYMYKGLDDEKYEKEALNITTAADWEHPRWGFDPYIVLTCDDPHNACKGHVGSDPRPVACYVNNTRDLFSTISQINCCGPFFTTDDIDTKVKFAKSKTLDNVGLDWMRTSGSYLDHEMMHTFKITQDRPRVIDQFFDGVVQKRVYGPKLCARAAAGGDVELGIYNADSYAELMLAMYYKDVFNGHLFKPESTFTSAEAPEGFNASVEKYDFVSDSDNNYNDLESMVIKPQLTCAGEPADKPSVKQQYVTTEIQKYCDIAVSTDYIVDNKDNRYGPRGSAGGDSAPESDNTLWISLTKDPGCEENTRYQVDMQQCLDTFNTILNGCNTNSIDKKWGGEAQAYCTLWNITTVFGQDPTPPNGYT